MYCYYEGRRNVFGGCPCLRKVWYVHTYLHMFIHLHHFNKWGLWTLLLLLGDGKTHFINKKMKEANCHLTIAINEAFSMSRAIEEFKSIPFSSENVAIHFNFMLLPTKVKVMDKPMLILLYIRMSCIIHMYFWQDKDLQHQISVTVEAVKSFFFNMLFWGYVEDKTSGISFHFPWGQRWKLYIEVITIQCVHSVYRTLMWVFRQQ